MDIHSSGHLPPWLILTSLKLSIRAYTNYIGGKPACNTPKNMGSTKGVLLMLDMRQLVIKEMSCINLATVIGPLLALEKPLPCVEIVQHLVMFIIGLNLTKTLENLGVTRQSVWVISISTHILIHKLQG